MGKKVGVSSLLAVVGAILLGSIFSVIMPPMKSFDEADHLRRAYFLTRGKIFLHNNNCDTEGVLCRNGETMSGGKVDSGFNEYLVMRHEIVGHFERESLEKQRMASQIRWSGKRVFHEAPGTGYYFPLIYTPQAIGLAIGRALDLTIENSYYLSRFFVLAFSVAALTLAFSMVRPMPSVLAILVLPVSLFQAASASIDAFSISLTVLSVAIFIRCMRERTGRMAFFVMCISIFLVVTSRVHQIAMLAMPFVIAWGSKDRKVWGAALCTALASAIWLAVAIPSVVDFRVVRAESTADIALFYISNMGALVKVFANTVAADGFLVNTGKQFVGHTYGLLFPWSFYSLMLWLVLVIGILGARFGTKNVFSISRSVLFAIGVLSVPLAMLAMLLTFTVHPAQVINGIQGRYFVAPMIIVAYAVCDWERIGGVRGYLQWACFGVVLFSSVLMSVWYMVNSFYTPLS